MTIYESNFGRRVELRTKSDLRRIGSLGPGRLLVHRDLKTILLLGLVTRAKLSDDTGRTTPKDGF